RRTDYVPARNRRSKMSVGPAKFHREGTAAGCRTGGRANRRSPTPTRNSPPCPQRIDSSSEVPSSVPDKASASSIARRACGVIPPPGRTLDARVAGPRSARLEVVQRLELHVVVARGQAGCGSLGADEHAQLEIPRSLSGFPVGGFLVDAQVEIGAVHEEDVLHGNGARENGLTMQATVRAPYDSTRVCAGENF